MIRYRHEPNNNYHSFYTNGITYRKVIDSTQPILRPKPESWDVHITNYCNAKCSYCYMNSTPQKSHAQNLIQKTQEFFKPMENQKPYYVTIGGGEPTSHPDFEQFILTLQNLGIDSTFSTNGLYVLSKHSQEHLQFVKENCISVAVTAHNHLPWKDAIQKYLDYGILTSLHTIIQDDAYIDEIIDLYNIYSQYENFKALLILPQVQLGRSNDGYKGTNCQELVDRLEANKIELKFGFGAQMYPFIKEMSYLKQCLDLHEPEFYTRYINMITMKQYENSFKEVDR